VLRRMATEAIADRRALFELFTESKNRALAHGDRTLSLLLDSCIDLWTKMYQADAEHDKAVMKKVQALQVCCKPCGVLCVTMWCSVHHQDFVGLTRLLMLQASEGLAIDKLEGYIHAMQRAHLFEQQIKSEDERTPQSSSQSTPHARKVEASPTQVETLKLELYAAKEQKSALQELWAHDCIQESLEKVDLRQEISRSQVDPLSPAHNFTLLPPSLPPSSLTHLSG
jgi:hypothetical protein